MNLFQRFVYKISLVITKKKLNWTDLVNILTHIKFCTYNSLKPNF